ncbi:hypothetical protein VD0002_g7928 [Verticillium dahliae]|uniref:Aldehyde dehydrogenase domain-containing protein n=1 Tax=Verticillium dahliae TaxID=27337 RepID=A0AA44WQI0_VERDA|nr:salicylaldehyde dehydrogenase [Verticillium dahliae]PNH35853.1 hypothetical protein BJF96_g668 [Verticillium dahliae]PNH47810.1 hypothetical protein VD0003_g8733 [Verticillium dahliae]PNH59629.1 hypothetical protein VD0002_g7928 [Verticillium dahliae]
MSNPTSVSSAALPPTSSDSPNTVPFFLNGAEKLTSKTFPVTSPGTNQYLYQSASAQTSDAEAAVAAAAAALPAWRALKPAKRAAILVKTAEIMNSRHAELAGYLTSETGAIPSWADFNLKVTINILIASAARVHSVEGIIPTPAGEGCSALIVKEPFGVVLAIAPWNAPYILGVRAIAGPLVTGNTVVLKGPEVSPRVTWAIASCFHEAGLPHGVLNTLAHDPSDAPAVTAALIAHRDVKKINFTGSTGVGRIIGRLAGEHLKPVLLELGGKAPAIVWEDADLQLAAQECAHGAFRNAGQICMSTERIVVHKAVSAAFESALRDAISNIFLIADAPALIASAAVTKNKKLVRDAVAQGARVIAGDPNADEASPTRMRPVVLGSVTPEMDIYQTESFGPTVSLYEVETEEEALRIANDTEYGLTSAVFTEDLRRGLRFAKNIETGAVHINSMTVHDEPALPHGGAKASGYGRFNAGALEEWVRTKTITYQD